MATQYSLVNLDGTAGLKALTTVLGGTNGKPVGRGKELILFHFLGRPGHAVVHWHDGQGLGLTHELDVLQGDD